MSLFPSALSFFLNTNTLKYFDYQSLYELKNELDQFVRLFANRNKFKHEN